MFLSIRDTFDQELEQYYSQPMIDREPWYAELNRRRDDNPDWAPYRHKAMIYELAVEVCDVHVFRHCPFYFAIDAGLWRSGWEGGIGSWMTKHTEYGQWYEEQGWGWQQHWSSVVGFNGKRDSDLDHHSVGYDNILSFGLHGLIRRAEERLAQSTDEKSCAFLHSVILGLDSLKRCAQRFAEKAEYLLQHETDPAVRSTLQRVADTARRCPTEPPQTFYEALNTIIFTREIIMPLEGARPSTYGHLDRMLGPYLQRDIQAGTITHEEARDLMYAFLAITDTKYECRRKQTEPSTTVVIGGCDATGTPVCNEVTHLILDAYQQLQLVNPKFLIRVSKDHPEEFFHHIGEYIAAGTNNCALYNDEVMINASIKAGKAPEDARLYVGGGCQENVLQNCEISSRATMFFNTLAVLEMGLFPEAWDEFTKREQLDLTPLEQCETFEAFYDGFMRNLRQVTGTLVSNRNRLEAESWRYNPMPLLSATLDDCIDNARDMTEGGCRYSTGSVDLCGVGTLVDSLWSIRRVVYERGDVPMHQLKRMLENNFQSEEAFRRYLLTGMEKYGRDNDPTFRDFVAKAFADIAAHSSGFPNSRGGTYLASMFAHRMNVLHGPHTGATPDGRKRGHILSKGMGPSQEALGPKAHLGELFLSLEDIDMTNYPVVSMLDLKIPPADGAKGALVVKSVLKRFLQAGGSGLQFNVVRPEVLLEARENPASHPDLVVRVSGFSAYFAHLGDHVKNEIIERALMDAG